MSVHHSNVHEVARIGFSKEVENYDKARPSYTTEAFNIALNAFGLNDLNNSNEKINVLDLAAGTGKFTKLLATNKNFNVCAVEPNEEMRKTFNKNFPSINIHDGTSSSIPFEDGFFQVVFIAQAFHWFANIESLRELHRVIKPQSECKMGKSGILLIWNMEDREAEPYIGELRDLYEKYDADAPQYRKNEWVNVFETKEGKSLFNKLDTVFVKNRNVYLPLSYVWSRILSKSYIARLDEQEQKKLKKSVDQVIEKYKQCQVKKPDHNELCLHYPYYTEITWSYK